MTGKGRPTPRRREAEQARKQRVRPTLSRGEAIRRERARAREQRARMRQGVQAGDERYFMERDRGPVRKFVRDYVDSRRTFTEYFLPLVMVVLLLSFVRSPQVQIISSLLWLAAIMFVVLELSILNIRVKREIARRFPDDAGRGHGFYAIARSTQLRRLRLPKPVVKPGTRV
ncbi:MAG: DUF3043 domain-containing protein [Jiangellaceae bacterium]|nr:DUF3043 domain-containing protein [Jiangellaceae bacterium]